MARRIPRRADRRLVPWSQGLTTQPRRSGRPRIPVRRCRERTLSVFPKQEVPHVLRHTCATRLAGVDTSAIALWLDHESGETLPSRNGLLQGRLLRALPAGATRGGYRPSDALLVFFLESL
jgi:integrase